MKGTFGFLQLKLFCFELHLFVTLCKLLNTLIILIYNTMYTIIPCINFFPYHMTISEYVQSPYIRSMQFFFKMHGSLKLHRIKLKIHGVNFEKAW